MVFISRFAHKLLTITIYIMIRENLNRSVRLLDEVGRI